MEHNERRAGFIAAATRHAERLRQSFPQRAAKVAFVENKAMDLDHVAELLLACARCNLWANRGPLYATLADAYHDHMNLDDEVTIVPCSNAGVGLEALARLLEQRAGRRLAWVGSAFTFANLARGWFTGMQLVDCDESGMLDLAALEALPKDSYDGFVVTNIFGLWHDFRPCIDFARQTGKHLLIDNAAGIDRNVPDWPYQSFSLHHTKPYGAGEGGLVLVPRDEAEALYGLLNYGPIEPGGASLWFNNGKVSDIACAFHLDRLASYAEWAPRYFAEAERVTRIATSLGLRPLVAGPLDRPATSRAFIAARPLPLDRLLEARSVVFGKYYQPLAPTPRARALFERLVNIPTHPGLGALSDDALREDLAALLT